MGLQQESGAGAAVSAPLFPAVIAVAREAGALVPTGHMEDPLTATQAGALTGQALELGSPGLLQ